MIGQPALGGAATNTAMIPPNRQPRDRLTRGGIFDLLNQTIVW